MTHPSTQNVTSLAAHASRLRTKDPETGIFIRLAQSEAEIQAAQRLRYKVFYEENNAHPSDLMKASGRDFDDFDDFADHLVVIDTGIADPEQRIVGTYRLIQKEAADRYGQFYSSQEYEIAPLIASGASLLELGRSCVLPPYRTRPVMQLLWQGIADYIAVHGIELMFGCASLQGTDIKNIAGPLSYLYHYHLAPPGLRPRALRGRYINMNIVPREDLDRKRLFATLPPLIKGYLRLGGCVGDGAVVDEQFNTTDICIVVQTHLITNRYRRHYERKIQKSFTDLRPDEAVGDDVLAERA